MFFIRDLAIKASTKDWNAWLAKFDYFFAHQKNKSDEEIALFAVFELVLAALSSSQTDRKYRSDSRVIALREALKNGDEKACASIIASCFRSSILNSQASMRAAFFSCVHVQRDAIEIVEDSDDDFRLMIENSEIKITRNRQLFFDFDQKGEAA